MKNIFSISHLSHCFLSLKVSGFIAIALIISQLLVPQTIQAQGEASVINFSGLIVSGDSAYGIRGAHVFIPRANTGTITNHVGFFSMPALAGDTVFVSCIGYKTHKIVIPRNTSSAYSVAIDMKSADILLRAVEVFPFSDEKMFKDAFLALELPSQRYENMEKNLNQEKITNMAMAMPMDGSLNYRFYMRQQVSQLSNRNSATTIPLLNPFAWAELIRSIKRGDFKRKDDDD